MSDAHEPSDNDGDGASPSLPTGVFGASAMLQRDEHAVTLDDDLTASPIPYYGRGDRNLWVLEDDGDVLDIVDVSPFTTARQLHWWLHKYAQSDAEDVEEPTSEVGGMFR